MLFSVLRITSNTGDVKKDKKDTRMFIEEDVEWK